jgi:hypothetical protein
VSWVLADCDKPHHEEVLGFVPIGELTYDKASDNSDKMCFQKFGAEYEQGNQMVTGWFFEEDHETGFGYVTCTVAHTADDKKLPGGSVTTPAAT